MSFIKHKNCTGCGLCSLESANNIKMEWDKGFLYPHALEENITPFQCSMNINPVFHSSLEKHVAYHKILERRMDGSAGGVYGAILETLVNQDAFFTGTIYGEDLKVHHILTQDPEQIKKLSGYKPTQSDPYILFSKIKELLEKDELVLFGGLPCQCHALTVYLGKDYDNLYIVDIICDGVKSQDLIDMYAGELRNQESAEVVDIRYYNKEYSNNDSKRIRFSNGRMIYTSKTEPFDLLLRSGHFTRSECKNCSFMNLKERLGDISIGAYKDSNSNIGGRGLSFVSINTNKGIRLFDKVKKRLVLIDDSQIIENLVSSSKPVVLEAKVVNKTTIDSTYKALYPESSLLKIRHKIGRTLLVLRMLKKISRLHPRPLYQFVKYNYFSKSVKRCGGLIYLAPHCEFLLEKDITIEVHSSLIIGLRRIPSSKLETRVRMCQGSRLIVHKESSIGNGSNIEIYKNAVFEIGSLHSNAPIVVICGDKIRMGEDVNIARGCTIRDTNGHLVVMPGYKVSRPVEIGNHVWICSDSTVMPGVNVGDGSIIGACSFVTQKVLDHTLVQGFPAKEVAKPNYFVM